jgi:hypothetical protein
VPISWRNDLKNFRKKDFPGLFCCGTKWLLCRIASTFGPDWRTAAVPPEFTRRLTYLSFHGGFAFRMLQCSPVTIESEHGTKPSSLFFFYTYTRHHYFFVDAGTTALYFFFSPSRFPMVASQISPCSVDLTYRQPASIPWSHCYKHCSRRNRRRTSMSSA